MSSTPGLITTAANQYAHRPKDERFPSVEAMIAAAEQDRDHSAEKVYNLKDLKAVAATISTTPSFSGNIEQQSVMLESPKGRAHFTHYSFGQLARTIGAPAGYLRQLPPALAADCINHGLKDSEAGTRANLLVRLPNGQPDPIVRACTSDTYGRVWDAELYGRMARLFMDPTRSRSVQTGQAWQTPPTWTGEPAGAYRGDRDSFVVIVDGGSMVTDPSLSRSASGSSSQGSSSQGNAPADGMYRGLLVRNSEVGHCSISIECVLFRVICGNHMLWGAIMDRQFKRRHVGSRITGDVMRELGDLAWKFTQRSASQDEQIVRHLIDTEIAHTKEAVIDELKKLGATKQQAEDAYSACERTETSSPRSFWGLAQGLTRNSQEAGYQDERLQLDQLGAALLKRGLARVTV